MTTFAPALAYALFAWWFATGLVLLFVTRGHRTVCALGATLLFVLALYGVRWSATQTNLIGAYLAFTMAILVWGAQEVAFLTGLVTGPRPLPLPPGVSGIGRLRYALGAILYHEVGLIVAGACVLMATWQAPNQIGGLTFLVLWGMRISAKLNLFLGVPVLNDEMLPGRLAFLRSYFRRAPASPFFPVSILLSVLALSLLVSAAVDPAVSPSKQVGDLLVAALLVLGIVEHAFMLVQLPIARLWAWGEEPSRRGVGDLPRDRSPDEMERVAVTLP